jgi:hypothetical protein
MTVLTDKRGRELFVPTLDLLDAWLAWQMHGKQPGLCLSRRVSVFLSGARVRSQDGEMLVALQRACREYWHKEKEAKR